MGDDDNTARRPPATVPPNNTVQQAEDPRDTPLEHPPAWLPGSGATLRRCAERHGSGRRGGPAGRVSPWACVALACVARGVCL